MAVGTWQNGHSQLAAPNCIMIAAVEKHRRAVGEYHKHRLGDASIDEMNLELTSAPSLPGLTDLRVFHSAGKGCLEIQKGGCSGKSCRSEKVSSIHCV
jgi:hypothetical protein